MSVPGLPDVPNVARVYDWFLGGAYNFAVDRDAGKAIIARHPEVGIAARANRTFLRRMVEDATERGITQFLDLASGIPTSGNVHEIARRRVPDAKVAYVDVEPVVAAHGRTLLEGLTGVTITEADLGDPETVLAAPGVAGLLDFDQPVALMALAAFQLIDDDEQFRRVVDRYRRALAPGSFVAVVHASTGHPTEIQSEVNPDPVTPRSPERLRELIGELRIDADGMRDISVYARERTPVGDILGWQSFRTEPLEP